MKRTLSIALIFTLSISILLPFTTFANWEPPNLQVSNNYKMPVFKAGTEARLAIPLRNAGGQDAINIHAWVDVNTNPDVYPFEIEYLAPRVRVSMIHASLSDEIVLYYKVPSSSKAKVYPLALRLEYQSLTGTLYQTSETIFVKIENDNEEPKVNLHKTIISNDALTAGDTGKVIIDLHNNSKSLAKDIEVRLSGFSPSTFYLTGVNRDTKKISQLPIGLYNDSAEFDVTVDSKLETGVYTLDVTISYKDPFDVSYSNQHIIFIPVINKKDSNQTNAQVVLEGITFPKNALPVNQDFNVSFRLRNTSAEEARNVKVTVNGGSEILPKSMPVQSFTTLKTNETRNINFAMFAKDGVETKNYPIQFTVEYETGTGSSKTTQSFSQFAGVLIENNEDDKPKNKMTPKLILENYALDTEYTQAGKDFALSISLLNTHNSGSIRNITVNVSADGDVFSPVNSSNTFYIQAIDAQSRAERTLTLKPAIDAAFKTHNLHLDIQYEDAEGKQHSTKEVIGIPVMQEVRLMAGQIELPPEAMIGNPIPISTEYYNAGRANIRNLIIRLEGDFDTRDRSYYVGNMDAGKNNYYDATLTPTKPGPLTGKVIFEFYDAIDQFHVIENEFTVNITEFQDPYMGGEIPFDPNQGMPQQTNKMTYVYIATAIIILATVGFIWYKRRKNRLELAEVEVDLHA
ncbi:hypothetical protein BHU72_00030 [Desulfuribacillus stibiiarsenatis]|uniref:CARDB domain-containing protein n=1 Tax=Desulfuribacillus stibiiarsenatis TaxID=1390249 RepID=A0A1E5L969_9FIRM|nr:hypothetical protein [Desulfuribacillus stibiiarsenatis]OEH86702.1 hypothetical protein BHU72_00030 [Desulfuribacillus stibiiarsenatis]